MIIGGILKTMSKKILNNPYPISTQVEIEHAEYIAALAYDLHVSISQMVRFILLEYIKEHKRYIEDSKNDI